MKLYLLILFTMMSLSGIAQQKTVEESLETFRQLLVTPDQEKLNALAHKDLTYGHSSGKIENKAEFIDQLVSKRSDFKKVDFLEQQIFTEGKTAIVRHILEADTFNNQVAGHIRLKILLVWVKDRKDWKLIARQAVKI